MSSFRLGKVNIVSLWYYAACHDSFLAATRRKLAQIRWDDHFSMIQFRFVVMISVDSLFSDFLESGVERRHLLRENSFFESNSRTFRGGSGLFRPRMTFSFTDLRAQRIWRILLWLWRLGLGRKRSQMDHSTAVSLKSCLVSKHSLTWRIAIQIGVLVYNERKSFGSLSDTRQVKDITMS